MCNYNRTTLMHKMIDRYYIRNGVPGWPEKKQEELAPDGVPIYRDILGASKLKAMKAGNASLLVERAAMLRPTSRQTKGEEIGVAAIHVIGFNVQDVLATLAAAWKRGAVFVDVSAGRSYSNALDASQIAELLANYEKTRKRAQTEAARGEGHAAHIAKKLARTEKALKIARPLWGDKDAPSAAIIAEKAGCSVRLLYDNLGPRSRAKARQARREKRK